MGPLLLSPLIRNSGLSFVSKQKEPTETLSYVLEIGSPRNIVDIKFYTIRKESNLY